MKDPLLWRIQDYKRKQLLNLSPFLPS